MLTLTRYLALPLGIALLLTACVVRDMDAQGFAVIGAFGCFAWAAGA